jgi:hypothetical protein
MSWTVRPLLDELLAGLARAAGATTAEDDELSLVSTTPASIRMSPQISTTSPPATADPKPVEKNLLTLCTRSVSVQAVNPL